MKTCPNCKTQVGDEAVFCGECGQRLQEPAETTDNRAESSQNDSAEQPRDKKQENFPMQFIWIVVALAVVGVLFAYWKLILMLICWICFIAACVYVVRMFLAKREAGEEYESDPSYKSFKERAIGFGVGFLIAMFIGSCGLSGGSGDAESVAIAEWEADKNINEKLSRRFGIDHSITRHSVETLEKTDNTAVVRITYSDNLSSAKFTRTYHLKKQSNGKWEVIKAF